VRFFASAPTQDPSADRPSRWPAFWGSFACRRRLRQVMHRPFSFSIRTTFRYLSDKPVTAWPGAALDAIEPIDELSSPRPGDAPGVLPFAVLFLPVVFEASAASISPHAV